MPPRFMHIPAWRFYWTPRPTGEPKRRCRREPVSPLPNARPLKHVKSVRYVTWSNKPARVLAGEGNALVLNRENDRSSDSESADCYLWPLHGPRELKRISDEVLKDLRK